MAYTKTNWTTSTPINPTNLNHIENGIANSLTPENIKTTQTNSDTATYSCNYIESLKGEVLYSSGGVAESFTLTKSATGYKYIEVFYTSDEIYQSVKFEYEADRKFSTTNIYTSDENSREYIYNSTWKINASQITRISTRNNFLNPDNTVGSYGSNPYILIYKVIGYK